MIKRYAKAQSHVYTSFQFITLTLLHRLAKVIPNYQIIIFPVIKNKKQVGLAGFEPTTSGTQNQNHTKLDHNPNESAES